MGRDPMPKNGHGAFRLTVDDLNRVLGEALDANKGSVDRWLSGPDKVKAFTATFRDPIGRYYLHEVVDSHTATVILRRDTSAPQGFFIKTAFPTPPEV
ncbi:RNase A-like domain-containing protein [Curtobacterium sp. MCBA15_008]|uniref:RNase A-like domain-containing protein n=1 Tax=Curtobacterium sp. MCBA15_008 TaxID=1898736 RepID=UPI001113A730|nr:RNase A-like domain-containing protein [Curtobacterium sp. MCBA15_008]